jgi:L-2-hydroxyglutarate oxidase LhgO
LEGTFKQFVGFTTKRAMAVDTLIIGGGVIGLTTALEIKRREPRQRVLVVEAEKILASHGSGRNSGVLHSGIYYPPESLKAKMCAQGAAAMREYCLTRNLPLAPLGKVLVPTRIEDDPQLDLLASRAGQNGVEARMLNATELAAEEPAARSASGRALLVPVTSVCSPHAVMKSLADDCIQAGIDLRMGWRAGAFDPAARTATSQAGDTIRYRLLINAAGLHADTVAHAFGVGRQYHILPFKGLYWKLDPASGIRLNHLVYPVPDLRVPFLGVHTTTATDGTVYLGPTAIPALGRENYRGLSGIVPADIARIAKASAIQFARNTNGFRRLAIVETGKLIKSRFAAAVQRLIPAVRPEHLLPSTKVGMRAQLYDSQSKVLINDFLVEREPSSVHILNAISPAWTCSFPFAAFICDNYVDDAPKARR